MTLTELRALDFVALWAGLTPERQAAIGATAIEHEMSDVVANDGGFDTSEDDRGAAWDLANTALDVMSDAVQAAFPDLLPIDHDGLYPIHEVMEAQREDDAPARGMVHGMPRQRKFFLRGGSWFVRVGGEMVELAGAVDLASRDAGAPPNWLFWTVPDVETERLRRHPELVAR